MNLQQTIAYLESLSPTLEKPGLRRILTFMKEHRELLVAFPSFHVGGTNGKGSTVAVLDSLLRASGYKVGRFTGPHLLRWNERFHVDGAPISDERFSQCASKVRELSESFGRRYEELGPLTWFEFLTAIAFFLFAESKIDVAVFEVGLGGRFDATNVLERRIASVITNIDLDHTHILGNTVEEIAFEKAGIIKLGVPLITGASGAALEVIAVRAQEERTDMVVVGARDTESNANGESKPQAIVKSIDVLSQSSDCDSRLLAAIDLGLNVFTLLSPRLALNGPYQFANAALAMAALFSWPHWRDRFALDSPDMDGTSSAAMRESIEQGLSSVYWPGRMQFVEQERMILDGAHNAAGAAALRTALDELLPDCPRCFVIGCYQNKRAEEMLRALVRTGDRVFVSEASGRRPTFDKESLRCIGESLGAASRVSSTIGDALASAKISRRESEVLIVTGSFATVKEAAESIGWQSVEDGRDVCVSL